MERWREMRRMENRRTKTRENGKAGGEKSSNRHIDWLLPQIPAKTVVLHATPAEEESGTATSHDNLSRHPGRRSTAYSRNARFPSSNCSVN